MGLGHQRALPSQGPGLQPCFSVNEACPKRKEGNGMYSNSYDFVQDSSLISPYLFSLLENSDSYLLLPGRDRSGPSLRVKSVHAHKTRHGKAMSETLSTMRMPVITSYAAAISVEEMTDLPVYT